MSTRVMRWLRAVAALTIAGVVLPTAAPAAHADPGPAYGGYSSSAWSTPVRVEVYEPTIPLPSTPQVELELGYSSVQADSGSSQGRASYLWPGDSIGEGLPTYAEQLGLPPEAFKDGYPLQVNSAYPSEATSQRDEPFPGMVMRTESQDKEAVAQTGFSPDGGLSDPDAGEGGGSTNPLTGLLGQLPGLGGLLPKAPTALAATAADQGVPGLPAPLAAVVDMEGYVSTSSTTAADGPVVSTSRAVLGDVHLLAGLVTIGGLDVRSRSESSGVKGKAGGASKWGTLSLAGQDFELGPDGLVAGGQTVSVPGLPADLATALLQLGISIQVPEAVRTVDGDAATSVSQGLVVVIDTAVLAPVIRALPTAALAQLLPDGAGPLKSLIGGISSLSPKIVLTLGIASTTADTEPPVDSTPPPDQQGDEPPADTGGKAPHPSGSTGGAAPGPGSDSAPTDAAPAGPSDTAPLVDASAPTVPGLPPLFSIPGMLLLGAIAAAAFAGNWFRRLGAAALGGGAACEHGLDSGLPDLRKA